VSSAGVLDSATIRVGFLVPRANGSRSLLISGVKSGLIRSEYTENWYCHMQSHSKPYYERATLCVLSKKHRV